MVRGYRTGGIWQAPRAGTASRRRMFPCDRKPEESTMKGLIAWLLGVPIVIIIIFYLTGIF